MITDGEIIWVNVVAVCGTLNNYSQNTMLSESRKRTYKPLEETFRSSANPQERKSGVLTLRIEDRNFWSCFFYNCYFQIWICKLLFDIEWFLTRELVSIWGIYIKKNSPQQRKKWMSFSSSMINFCVFSILLFFNSRSFFLTQWYYHLLITAIFGNEAYGKFYLVSK